MIFTLSEKIAFIESVFGIAHVAKNCKNVEVWCPVCAPKDKNKKKLAIRTDDDRNHCWVCGYRSRTLVPLLKKYFGNAKLQEYKSKFLPDFSKTSVEDDVTDGQKLELPYDYKILANASMQNRDFREVLKYVKDRGLSERDIWFYKLGVSEEKRWHRRVIVPSFDSQGKLNYFVARAIDKFRKPKYDNPDFDKLPIIFNELNVDWTKRLVLCEGAFDMFKCGDNTVPLLGSDLNEDSSLFNMVLVNNTPIAMALDGDMWETKTIKNCRKLVSYDIDVHLVDTRSHSDPGSMTKQQFKEALNVAKPFVWESSFSTKLSRATRMSLSL